MWAFRICTNRNQIALPPLPLPLSPSPLPPPRSANHTQTHTHIAGSVLTTTGSRAASPCFRNTSWRYTIELFLLNLSHPTAPQPSPTHPIHTQKKKVHRAPARQKPCLCSGSVSFEEFRTSQEHRLYILLMVLFEYLRQAFVFLPGNLLLLWVRVLGFYHSKVKSVFPPNPFLLRRGPLLWCLKVAISPKRLWLPG